MSRRGQAKVKEMLQKRKTVLVLEKENSFSHPQNVLEKLYKVSCIVVCGVVLYGEVSSHQMAIAGYNDSMDE